MMNQIKRIIIILICLHGSLEVNGQSIDSLTRANRLRPLIIASSITYTGSMIALNELWYSDFDRGKFRFFDDSKEWNQMDKAGHFYAAFQITSLVRNTLDWAGMETNRSILYGAGTAFLVLGSIELFDGYSKAYGASLSDLIANTTGIAFYYGQQHLWGEIRLHPKFSYYSTRYPNYRPELLGETLSERIIKDYNGQTQWLSIDISRFATPGKFPKWLNIAFGYGAQGMIFAHSENNKAAGYQPRRQYYMAFDLDLSEYKSRSKVLNTILYFINMIHLPAPALEYSAGEFKFHYIY